MRIFLSALVVVALAQPVRADVKFVLTGVNTTIQFIGTKTNGKHEGGFKTLTGTALGTNSGLKIDIDIDMDSLYTDNKDLTSHLKGPDFFGVKANPKARFASTRIEKSGDVFNVTGELTLCGKVKAITFPAKITLTADTFTLHAEFKVNRHDLGITHGKDMIDADVVMKITLTARKQ